MVLASCCRTLPLGGRRPFSTGATRESSSPPGSHSCRRCLRDRGSAADARRVRSPTGAVGACGGSTLSLALTFPAGPSERSGEGESAHCAIGADLLRATQANPRGSEAARALRTVRRLRLCRSGWPGCRRGGRLIRGPALSGPLSLEVKRESPPPGCPSCRRWCLPARAAVAEAR